MKAAIIHGLGKVTCDNVDEPVGQFFDKGLTIKAVRCLRTNI